jgi:hypothetical protein
LSARHDEREMQRSLTVVLGSLRNNAQVSCLTDLLFASNDGLAFALSEDKMLLSTEYEQMGNPDIRGTLLTWSTWCTSAGRDMFR